MTKPPPQTSSWDLIIPFLRPLEGLIRDPEVSEICCNGDGTVFAERNGVLSLQPGIQLDQRSLMSGIKSIARQLGDDVNDKQPILDSRLEDGSRVAAVLPPASLSGITLSIRKFAAAHYRMADLIERGSITPELATILTTAVADRRNILISGGTGTGKTTLLNILADAIPDEDRIVVIEDTAEIKMNKPNLVRWEAKRERPGWAGVSIRSLVKAALRHRPDRIVLGEIRDASAYDLLQALNTGHSGSMSTVHADSARGALARFASLVLESGVQLPFGAVKANIGAALHYLVQIERRRGRRYVSEVIELRGYNPDTDVYDQRAVYTAPRQEH
jgi:pilus assembly protein CpaF